MEMWFLGGGIALCLFSLWALLRNDLVRLRGETRRVTATVIGHHASWEDGQRTYAAVYRFSGEDGTHEVVDPVYSGRETPPVGTARELVYPAGRPDLARPPRPWLWLSVYALLLFLLGMLVAKALGVLPAH